jgi:hypothetical protein
VSQFVVQLISAGICPTVSSGDTRHRFATAEAMAAKKLENWDSSKQIAELKALLAESNFHTVGEEMAIKKASKNLM